MSIALLSPHLGMPRGKVLDEHLYVSGAKALYHKSPGLWQGVPYTNPEHPPLGKYLIGLGVEFVGDNSVVWRVAPVLFGSLTLMVIFIWMSNIADPFTAQVANILFGIAERPRNDLLRHGKDAGFDRSAQGVNGIH